MHEPPVELSDRRRRAAFRTTFGVLITLVSCIAPTLAAQTLVPIGAELMPPQVDEAVVSRPSVAMTPSGDALVVWEEFRRIDGVDSSEIHGRAYDRDGMPYGDSFRIDQPSDGIPGDPQVVARPDGSYLVSWMTSGFLGFADIVARPVGTDGELDGPEIVLVRETYFEGSRETHVSAISPRTGDQVTAWSSANPSGEGFMVYRRFTADGVPGSFGELGPGVGRQPVVDIADDGTLVAVWREGLASPGRLLARRFSASDEPLSDALTLADESIRRADVVILSDGVVVIAWVDADGAPVVRRFEGPGLAASGPAVRLAEANDAADIQLASVGRQLFASWSRPDGPDGNSRDVVGRFLSADLALLGDVVRLNPSSERDQDAGSIASNGSDRMIVAWWHQLPDVFTGKRTIRAQVFEIESACGAGPTRRLCLNDDRFAVEASWRSPDGSSGMADARPLTDDSGTFAFFDPDNVELLVKVLDACQPPFERYWVFAAGLTDVEVDLVVTDTVTGEIRRYSNPLSTPFEPILDTNAFDTCP